MLLHLEELLIVGDGSHGNGSHDDGLSIGGSHAGLRLRYLELAFRKPFFAGDRAVTQLRAFRVGPGDGGLAVRGSLTAAGSPQVERARDHIFGRLVFGEGPGAP